jgi:hypothetical protein
LGAIAHKKGEKTLGLVAIILSAIFMVIGFILGAYVGLKQAQIQGAAGLLFPIR